MQTLFPSVGVLKCRLTGHMMNKQMMNKHLVSVEVVMRDQWSHPVGGGYAKEIMLKTLRHIVFVHFN